MAGKISDLFVNIGAKTDDFKKGVKETENEASGLSKTFAKIGGVIAGAFAVSSVVAFGKECVQLANIAEGVEAAFKRIGDQSTLEGLRKATKGTVSDLELMKAAVQANNFGIPLKQLGSLLEFAHQRAKDTGQSVDYLVQSIVMGIGRKCLIGETLISTPVGLKRLDSFKENEIVLTKTLTGETVEGIINAVHYNGVRHVWTVELVNGYKITGTDNHRLYTSKGYKMISELNTNSEILTNVGLIYVKSIIYKGLDHVWDITIPETENFIANGIISHNSPLILDNLGISAVQLREKFNGLGAEQKSVADVAKAVGEIAADAMKKVGESAETSAERTARLNAAWENSKVLWGKAINTIKDGLLPILVKLAEKSAEVAKNIGLVFKYGLNGAKAYQQAEYELTNSIEAQSAAYLKNGSATDELSARQKSISESLRLYTSYIKDASLGDEYQRKVWQFKIDMLKEMQRSLEATAAATLENGDANKSTTTELTGLLEIQKKKIEDLKKQIEQAPTTTFAAKLTNDLIAAENELSRLQQKIRTEAFGAPVGQGLKPMQGKTATSVGSANLTPSFDERKMTEIANSYKSGAQEIETTNIELSDSMASMASTFADSVGQMAAGAMSMEDFGKTMALAMVGFIKTLGEQMIAVGVAGIALEMAWENPYLALAAGIALVALAGAASATLKSKGGSTGGGGYSTNSSAYNNTGSALTVEIEGVVKGSDIYFTQKNYNKTLNSTVSRG